jgi:uncharacterized membrane protein
MKSHINVAVSIFRKPLFYWSSILLAGFIIFSVKLANESLWFDEAFSAAMIKFDYSRMMQVTVGDVHPPLYYVMLKVFTSFFGNTEISLRLLSVFGVLCLIGLGPLAVRRVLDEKCAIVFTFLVMLSPMFICVAREARMYSWATFFVTGSGLYGYLASREGKLIDWIIFSVMMIASCYTHYYALFAVMTICAFLYIRALREKLILKPYHITFSIVCISFLPWLTVLIYQFYGVLRYHWIPPLNFLSLLSIITFPLSDKFAQSVNASYSWIIALLSGAIVLGGMISAFRRKKHEFSFLFMSLCTFSIVLMMGLLLSIVFRPLISPRYMVPCYGLIFISLAYGIVNLKYRLLVLPFIVILFGSMMYEDIYIFSHQLNGPYRTVKADIRDSINRKDVFVHGDVFTLATFSYYFPEHKQLYMMSRSKYFMEVFASSAYDSHVDDVDVNRIWGVNLNEILLSEIMKNHGDWMHRTYKKYFSPFSKYYVIIETFDRPKSVNP